MEVNEDGRFESGGVHAFLPDKIDVEEIGGGVIGRSLKSGSVRVESNGAGWFGYWP